MEHLDVDAAMIHLLQADGRMSVKELAVELNVPRAAVSRRLQQLVTSDAVRIVAALDPHFSGYRESIHALIEVNGRVEPLASLIAELPQTVFVASIAGECGLAFEARFGTEEEKSATLARIRSDRSVRRIITNTYVEVVKGLFVTRYRGGITLDETDHALISRLELDGRSTYRSLAAATGVSVSTARVRVIRLLAANVIRISAIEQRNVRNTQLGMGVGIVGHDLDGEMLEYLQQSEFVEFAARTYGQHDFVVTVVAPTPRHLHAVLEDLREIVPAGTVEPWPQLTVYKESYTQTFRRAFGGEHDHEQQRDAEGAPE